MLWYLKGHFFLFFAFDFKHFQCCHAIWYKKRNWPSHPAVYKVRFSSSKPNLHFNAKQIQNCITKRAIIGGLLSFLKGGKVGETIAESSYYVKYGSTIMMSKIQSKNLSYKNKKYGVSRKIIHVLSWMKTTEKAVFMFAILRFFD